MNLEKPVTERIIDESGTSSWFISWMLEQHEDQAQSMKSSSSAESRAELKCRVEVQNAQVQNNSSADQVQCTRAVIECEDRSAQRRSADKRKLQELLKSGCKQEEKKRSLNGLKKQPARTRPARCRSG
ncbi:hypothetical protein F511_27125 [Dorcoceras hygrometricum]|uniref:Uncharacterized protein n=1 Tax=Dorcoceras hygrometricum TaxID=472368 RepID=A0A2Z7B2D0_9LAMI|nr:hypothetical protein F511_27125 [Dorcoceras hygrometricum]